MKLKILATAVILLFIGLALAPSINANAVEDEMVEITIEFSEGKTNTIFLSKTDTDELEQYLDNIRKQLFNTTTRDETEEIFKDVIVELDKYGLLGDLDIEQAQNLVLQNNQKSKIKSNLERIYQEKMGLLDNEKNRFSLIAGKTSNTIAFGLLSLIPLFILLPITAVLFIFSDLVFDIIGGDPLTALIFLLLYCSPVIAGVLFPVEVFGLILFGIPILEEYGISTLRSRGWVFSIGLDGVKNWFSPVDGPLIPGYVFGFTGIKIYTPTLRLFFMGSAIEVYY